MTVTHERLISIGEQAANEVVGSVTSLDVASGINENGHPSYYFELHIKQGSNRARAMLLRTRLRQKIRDLLIAENDGNYPYVRIVGDAR